MQNQPPSPARPPYADLLADVTARLDDIVAEVASDIARPGEDLDELRRQVHPSVTWLIEHLIAASELSPEALATLRAEGRAAARSGEPLARLLDRYLSTGWVVWGAAARPGAESDVLAALGRALLRAGDAAAAAIGDGFSTAERELAARTASARREYLDELLDLAPGDAEAAARVRRRAAQFGLDPNQRYRVVVADLGRELEDGGPELDRVTLALQRPIRPDSRTRTAPIATTRRGRLVLLAPEAWRQMDELEWVLALLAEEGPWRAVASAAVAGLPAVAGAEREATQALAVAERAGRTGRFDADDLLLERALLADEDLARAAVAHELGPLLAAPRGGEELVRTLEVYVAAGHNVRRAARDLGVAPRTVAYRLTRNAELLGGRLEGARLLRLASALELRRLLGPAPTDRRSGAPRARRSRAAERAH